MVGKERIRTARVAELLRGKLDLPPAAANRITTNGPPVARILEMVVATIGVLEEKGAAPAIAQAVLARLETAGHAAVDAMAQICERVAAMSAEDQYDKQSWWLDLLGLSISVHNPVSVMVARKRTGFAEHLGVSRRSEDIRFAVDVAADLAAHLPRSARIMAEKMAASGDEHHADVEATAASLVESASLYSRDPVDTTHRMTARSIHGFSEIRLTPLEAAFLTDQELRQRVHTPDRAYIDKSRSEMPTVARLVEGYQSVIDDAGLPGTVRIKGGYHGHYGIEVDSYADDLSRKTTSLHWGKIEAFDRLLDISDFCRRQSMLHQRRITGVLNDLTTWVFDVPLLKFVEDKADDAKAALLALLANGPGTVKAAALRQAFGDAADGIRNMRLTINGNHIGARLPISDSIDWANGHVSIRRATLPETVLNAINSLKGSTLDNLIVHPWLPADAEILGVDVSTTADYKHRPSTETLTVKIANDPQPYAAKAA